MNTTFQIPNGGPLLKNVTPSNYIVVNANGSIYEHQGPAQPWPKRGYDLWASNAKRQQLGEVTDDWLDANNWRQACWQVPEPLRIGYYDTPAGLTYIAAVSASTGAPVLAFVRRATDTWYRYKWPRRDPRDWTYLGETA